MERTCRNEIVLYHEPRIGCINNASICALPPDHLYYEFWSPICCCGMVLVTR